MKFVLFFLCITCNASLLEAQAEREVLHLVEDTVKNEYSYLNTRGDTIIKPGKYLVCYTKEFSKLALVSVHGKEIVGIDRNEHILFNVYIFDNGPDYPANGLFRIIKDDKIGYADMNGNIVIKPQFDCAYPFKKGKARAGFGCSTKTDGEHSWWVKGKWYTIDKKGDIIDK